MYSILSMKKIKIISFPLFRMRTYISCWSDNNLLRYRPRPSQQMVKLLTKTISSLRHIQKQ